MRRALFALIFAALLHVGQQVIAGIVQCDAAQTCPERAR